MPFSKPLPIEETKRRKSHRKRVLLISLGCSLESHVWGAQLNRTERGIGRNIDALRSIPCAEGTVLVGLA